MSLDGNLTVVQQVMKLKIGVVVAKVSCCRTIVDHYELMVRHWLPQVLLDMSLLEQIEVVDRTNCYWIMSRMMVAN